MLQAQQMHHAVAGSAFGPFNLLPGLSVPTRLAQSTHDALTHGLYAAFRQGFSTLLSWVGQADQMMAAGIPGMQGAHEDESFPESVEAAVDRARASRMELHANGKALRFNARSLSGLNERVCVFVHGLACDEQSWHFDPGAWGFHGRAGAKGLSSGPRHYGSLLQRDLGFSPIYLRYNTSLSVTENGRHLSALLSRLVDLAPAHFRELVLIGHSLGGLVARSACDQASLGKLPWVARVPMVICLGSPHQGASLDRPGDASESLSTGAGRPRLSPSARDPLPLAKAGVLGERALRLIAGNLADDESGHLLGHLLGDGLVSTRSASQAGMAGDVQRVELAGLGHMALLNHPRVYAVIHEWLRGLPSLSKGRPRRKPPTSSAAIC